MGKNCSLKAVALRFAKMSASYPLVFERRRFRLCAFFFLNLLDTLCSDCLFPELGLFVSLRAAFFSCASVIP